MALHLAYKHCYQLIIDYYKREIHRETDADLSLTLSTIKLLFVTMLKKKMLNVYTKSEYTEKEYMCLDQAMLKSKLCQPSKHKYVPC